jgi:magnesium transporter
MIIDQAVYRNGIRFPCVDLSDELDNLAEDSPKSRDFLWIGLKDPTLAEFDVVKDELGLHSLAIEDSVRGQQRPKVDLYDGSLFVAMKPLHYTFEDSQVETGELMIFLGDRFIVTVRRGEIASLADIRATLEAHPEQLAHGAAGVLYAVLDSVVDNYLDIDRAVAADLEQLEERVFSGGVATIAAPRPHLLQPDRTAHRGRQDAQDIYSLKREVLEMRRAVVPLLDCLQRLAEKKLPYIPAETQPFFRDVNDHLARIADHLESYDRLLSDILSAHLARISVQQNDDMRKISAWVAIAAVPTMIAGIYGMNFNHIPELGWQLGYPAALLLMTSACLALYRSFRRSEWL